MSDLVLLSGGSLGGVGGGGDLDLDTSLHGDVGDLSEVIDGGDDVDDALVDAHLETIPGLGTLTARSLAGGDAEDLSGHADRALDGDVLLLGSLDEGSADLLEVLDVAAGEGHADLEEVGSGGLDLLIGRHFCLWIGLLVEFFSDKSLKYFYL